MIPLVVGLALSVPVAGARGSATTQDSIRDSQLCWRVCPACAVSCGKTSALDHLPESVAGAAAFDPMPRVGPVVGYLCQLLEAPCGRSPNTGVVR